MPMIDLFGSLVEELFGSLVERLIYAYDRFVRFTC